MRRFAHNIDVPDGFFFPRITEEQFGRAEWLDTLPLSVADNFTQSQVPISYNLVTLQKAWEHWCVSLSRQRVAHLHPEQNPLQWMNLQEAEKACRLYSQALDLSRSASEHVVRSCRTRTPPTAVARQNAFDD